MSESARAGDNLGAAAASIRAFIFDLDGTLVDTEALKSKAYAIVAQSLLNLDDEDGRAIDIYRRLVGNTDETVACAMIAELGLEAALGRVKGTDAATDLWRRLHELRLETYRERVATEDAIRAGEFEHNTKVLKAQKATGRLTAVATSSYRDEALRVLNVLGLVDFLDLIVGRDGVSNPKPDPEIYLKTMKELGVAPKETVIVEDSPVGLQAAVSSGAHWICVANSFSSPHLKAMRGVDSRWVVFEPKQVERTVAALMSALSKPR